MLLISLFLLLPLLRFIIAFELNKYYVYLYIIIIFIYNIYKNADLKGAPTTAATLFNCVLAATQRSLLPELRFGFPLNVDAHADHVVISVST